MSGEKVLVVDNNEESRDSIGMLLERRGYQVVSAANGEETIDRTPEIGPDAIIMSVQLGGKNGYEVTRELRDRGDLADLPVILLTAANSKEAFRAQRDWALNAGASDVLAKPVDEHTLLARLAFAINGSGPIAATTSAADASPAERAGMSEGDLDEIVKRLAQYIGPISDMLVRKVIREVDTRSELYRRLADHITDQVERERFISWAVNQT